jgi:hypothetical protein
MVELVDTQDLKSCDYCGRAGSSPAPGTKTLTEMSGFFCFIGSDLIREDLLQYKSQRRMLLHLECP